jgi:predicted transport protein
VKELYFNLKDRIMNLGEVEMKPNGNYISFRKKSPFVDIVLYNYGLSTTINMKEGSLNDPNSLMKTYGGKGHWGNGDYYTTIDSNTDLDYMMFLIKQSYQNKI